MAQDQREQQSRRWLLVLMAGTVMLVLVAFGLIMLTAGGGDGLAAGNGTPGVSVAAWRYANLRGDPIRGDKAFHGTCNACHGNDARGIAGLGKNLMTSVFLKGISDADFILFVTKGRPSSDPTNTTKIDMPPRGGNPALKDQDLADVVVYVRSLQAVAK